MIFFLTPSLIPYSFVILFFLFYPSFRTKLKTWPGPFFPRLPEACGKGNVAKQSVLEEATGKTDFFFPRRLTQYKNCYSVTSDFGRKVEICFAVPTTEVINMHTSLVESCYHPKQLKKIFASWLLPHIHDKVIVFATFIDDSLFPLT